MDISVKDLKDRTRGVLIGTAVGDSLGLPAEGISRRRIGRLFGGAWRHRFFFGRGMLSDDTEHTIFVIQSLMEAPGSPELFKKKLATRLKLWLMLLPAGVGLATLRSISKLCLGISPDKSGVYSAGNGPAMRVAPIGALFFDDPDLLQEYVRVSTVMTHSDPRALTGAMAIALCVAWAIRERLSDKPSIDSFMELLSLAGDDDEWKMLLEKMDKALRDDIQAWEFAEVLGAKDGISGYIYITVPIALYAWHKHFGNFHDALVAVLDCGGDTDTAGAIVGALAGAVSGEAAIPSSWIDGIADWPRGVGYLRRLSDSFVDLHGVSGASLQSSSVKYFWPGLIFRNIFFLIVVLFYGFRRMFPPY